MIERLTDKNPCIKCERPINCGACAEPAKWISHIKKKLTEYETAEEDGRLVVFPCDTVYFICDEETKYAHVRAKSILDLYMFEILGIDKYGRYWSKKEKAEKALKEMN